MNLSTIKDPVRLRQQAYRVISRTQDDPSSQVLGITLAFFAIAEALDLDINQLLETARRMKNDLDGPFAGTFRALEAYARNEIGRH